jgi:hypothetical protein
LTLASVFEKQNNLNLNRLWSQPAWVPFVILLPTSYLALEKRSLREALILDTHGGTISALG